MDGVIPRQGIHICIVQRTNLCRCEVSHEIVAMPLSSNAGEKKDGSGSAESARYIIRRQFRAAEFRQRARRAGSGPRCFVSFPPGCANIVVNIFIGYVRSPSRAGPTRRPVSSVSSQQRAHQVLEEPNTVIVRLLFEHPTARGGLLRSRVPSHRLELPESFMKEIFNSIRRVEFDGRRTGRGDRSSSAGTAAHPRNRVAGAQHVT
ncbi:hypothetical protein EVAR_27693_1 [Eumeta japonica]|uniref:Uncharacterized protein n=1 Tax=Eumeta variegata TaxID=151549 RepID=A0A4C1WNA4_EUMVA|nr:hypothetical protein EVAR_27693_1 [Eumeta japonica]